MSANRIGVMEWWSDGVMGFLNLTHYSTTPILHHSGYHHVANT